MVEIYLTAVDNYFEKIIYRRLVRTCNNIYYYTLCEDKS